ILLREFEPASVDTFGGLEMLQQQAVAAADIEHARTLRHHLCDGGEIGPQAHAMPRLCATELRKPRAVANSSGSSSRKESCPLSVTISTKLTVAPAALSACAMRLFSGVGNSQSLVKDAMQNFVLVP